MDDESIQAGGSPAAVRGSTWARRRPSLLATGGIWIVALVLLVLTLPQLVHLGGKDAVGGIGLVARYTSWAVQPMSAGYAVTVALAVPLFAALCFRRWSARTRIVIVASLTVVAVTCALVGYDQSQARSHLVPELERAIASLHLPPELNPLGPTRVLGGDDIPFRGGRVVPEAYRHFQPATATGPADCAVLGLIAKGQRGWTIDGCLPTQDTQTGNEIPAGGDGGSMVRAHGRVLITITFYPTNLDVHAYVITIQASPNDGYA